MFPSVSLEKAKQPTRGRSGKIHGWGLEPLHVSRSGVSWGPRKRPPVEERVCSAEKGLGLPEPGPSGTFTFGWLQQGQRTVSELP